MRKSLVAPLALGLLAACAAHQPGAQGTTPSADQAAAPRPRYRADRNTITQEEIAQYGASFTTLYDFVASRHSDWFMSNAAAGTLRDYQVQVYLDGSRFGTDATTLRQIPLRGVALAKRIGPSEAEGKYGTNNNGGAIEVWTSLERVQ